MQIQPHAPGALPPAPRRLSGAELAAARHDLPAVTDLLITDAITPAQFSLLAQAPQLRCLTVFDTTELTADNLFHLRQFDTLTTLTLQGMPGLNDAVLAHLSQFRALTSLDLWGSPSITDAALARLLPLPSLETLDLYETGITDATPSRGWRAARDSVTSTSAAAAG